MEKKFTGIGVSPGIAIGNIYLFQKSHIEIKKVNCSDITAEKNKLMEARNKTKEQLLKIRANTAKKVSEEKAQIFDAHITLLEDDDLLEEVHSIIDDENVNCDYALSKGIEGYKQMLLEVEDEYLRERAGDLEDISDRWLRNIQGQDILELSDLPANSIVIARDLTPSDTANIDLENTFWGCIDTVR